MSAGGVYFAAPTGYTGAVERKVKVVVRKDADGTYLASSLEPHVTARGRTVREAVASLEETVMLALESDYPESSDEDVGAPEDLVNFEVELESAAVS